MTPSHSDGNLSHASGAPHAATGPARRSTSRRRRCLFIVVVLSVFVALQEIILRFTFPVPETLFNRSDYRAPPKPLCNVIVRWECEPDGLAFDHTLNLYGFRGPDFTIAPPTDRPRILFIGEGAGRPTTIRFRNSSPDGFSARARRRS
jgi:hypothetical protein